MKLTDEDRRRHPHHTDSSIVSIKTVKSLTDVELESLTQDEQGRAGLGKRLGDSTNPSWVMARIADELYERSLVDEIQYENLLNSI